MWLENGFHCLDILYIWGRLPCFLVFVVLVTLDILCMLELNSIVFIAINWIEYMVMSISCVVDERVWRRTSKWCYFSVYIDIRIHFGLYPFSNKHSHSSRMKRVMWWREEGCPSHYTWSSLVHKGNLPCEWLGDNPLRPNSIEFGNHRMCRL